MSRQSPGTRALDRGWIPVLAVFTAVMLCYARTAFYGLTGFDDRHLLSGIANAANPLVLLTRNAIDYRDGLFYYRPMLTFSFWLTGLICPHGVIGHHVVNILIHFGACLSLHRLLREQGATSSGAVMASVMFAAHPLLTQAVAWLPGRNDSLLALFIVPAAVAAIRFLRTGRSRWLALSLAGWLLGLLTKESAALLPLALIPLLWQARAGCREKVVRTAALAAGFAVMFLVYWRMRQTAAVLAGFGPPVAFNSARLALGQAAMNAGKAFLPCCLNPIARVDAAPIWALIAGLAIGVLALAAAAREDRKAFVAGFSWFLLFLLPAVSMSNGFTASFEHRMYLPMIGVCLAMTGIYEAFKPCLTGRRVVSLALAGLLGAAVVGINVYSGIFRDDLSFWRYAAAHAPVSAEAQYNLGVVYGIRGDPARAAMQFQRAVSLAPGAAPAWYGWGVTVSREADSRWARRLLNEAVRLDPGNTQYRQAYDRVAKDARSQ